MTEFTLLNERYKLIESLGSGGMAVVYRAQDLMLERPVAVKILRQNLTQDEEFRELFRQEARAAANLSHPNIVTVHDFGISDGFPFIVMEYVPGPHLKRLIQQQGRFPVARAISLMKQACAGVGYAHRAGLVHCDIKPHNMVVTPDQQLKVTDFGIARALASIHPEEQAEVVWGSPQYFSPEQAAGSAPSPASDVYSLGVVMYEMLTGQLPFIADTPAALAEQHQTKQPTRPRAINPDISVELERVILKLLSKDPAARYRTADQLGRVLNTISDNDGRTYATVEPPPTQTVTVPPLPKPTPTFPTNQPEVHYTYYPTADPRENSRPLEKSKPHPSVTQPIDWMTVLLGLIALIAVGGLIPFWLWVYFSYFPSIP